MGRPRFGARDARLAHIVLSEIPWLHTAGLPEDRGQTAPALSPRLRTDRRCRRIGLDEGAKFGREARRDAPVLGASEAPAM